MNERLDIQSIKATANRNIAKVFNALGLTDFVDHGDFINSSCPIHGGDNPTAFSWSYDLNIYKCFTNHCDEKYGSDVFGLVAAITGKNFIESVKWVDEILKSNKVRSVSASDDDFIRKIRSRKRKQAAASENYYPEEALDKLLPCDYLQKRGFSDEIISRYQIGKVDNLESPFHNRVVIPIRGYDCKIIGFTGRTLDPDYSKHNIPKWRHDDGFGKSFSMFNLCEARESIQMLGTAIIVEGPLDCLKLEMAEYHNSVALLGTSMSIEQRNMLLQCGAQRLILALDADDAGKKGADRIKKQYGEIFSIEEVTGYSKDVGDLTVEELHDLFKEIEV